MSLGTAGGKISALVSSGTSCIFNFIVCVLLVTSSINRWPVLKSENRQKLEFVFYTKSDVPPLS